MIPAILLCCGMLILPESPRWLSVSQPPVDTQVFSADNSIRNSVDHGREEELEGASVHLINLAHCALPQSPQNPR